MNIEETKTKKKYFEISVLNAFMCILVVFIHVSTAPLGALESESWQYIIIMIPRRGFAFVVQGFIFLSGMKLFLSRTKQFSYGSYLAKRFLHVILPYIIWVVIYYLYFAFYRHYFTFSITSLLRYMYVGDLVSPFYYIIIIAQFYILAPFWRKIIAKANPVILTSFALLITIISTKYLPEMIAALFPNAHFMYADRVFATYLIYWIAGCFAGLNYEKFKKTLSENRMLINTAFGFALVYYIYLCYLRFSQGKGIAYLEDVRIFYCICAILFFFSAAVRISERRKTGADSRFDMAVSSIDKVSYSIYLAHCLVIFELDHILEPYASMSVKASYPLRLIIVYAVTICGSLLWRRLRDAITAKLQ